MREVINIYIFLCGCKKVIQFSETVIRYGSVCDDCYLIDGHTDKTKEWMS